MKTPRGAITTVLVTLLLAGCGSGGTTKPIGSKDAPCTGGGGCDPGLVCSAHVCVSLADSGTAPLPNGCSSSVLGGIGIPAGTVASANASYTSTASAAIDGNLTTGWNSGSYSGWLRLDLPEPTAVTGIHLAAMASPTASETYTITADGGVSAIGSGTRQVISGTTPSQLAPITVTPETYSSITITANGGASWVMIMEVALVTADCPVSCGCETRMCGDDGCGTNCGSCEANETCQAGDCVSTN